MGLVLLVSGGGLTACPPRVWTLEGDGGWWLVGGWHELGAFPRPSRNSSGTVQWAANVGRESEEKEKSEERGSQEGGC